MSVVSAAAFLAVAMNSPAWKHRDGEVSSDWQTGWFVGHFFFFFLGGGVLADGVLFLVYVRTKIVFFEGN